MHDMLERLLELKGFCDDMSATIPELHMTLHNWTQIEMIASALKLAKIATKLFQCD